MENGAVTDNEQGHHQYGLLEDPRQDIEYSERVSMEDSQQLSRGSSSPSQDSSVSIQDNNPEWIVSPVVDLDKPRPQRRRVAPYRVSLILPHWEGRSHPALPSLPSSLHPGRSPAGADWQLPGSG